jgi:DNA-binding GntR family transcriptional regulator
MDKEFLMNMDEFLPLRDVVFNTLRQRILTGELKPGERLMEIHLANCLGVSRTPIREAIHKLSLEGLVTMVPRRGAEVSRISKQDLQDVLEVRRTLDTLAVRLACARMTDEEKQNLHEANAEFAKSTLTKDATTIAQSDVKFHDIILMSTGNRRLVQMVNNLAEQVYRYRLEYVKDSRNHMRLIEEHDKISNSIAKGDNETAEKLIQSHIDNQELNIISQLDL